MLGGARTGPAFAVSATAPPHFTQLPLAETALCHVGIAWYTPGDVCILDPSQEDLWLTLNCWRFYAVPIA